MKDYTCETCKKSFGQKGHLESHKNRKKPCKEGETIEQIVEKKLHEALTKKSETPVVPKHALSLFSGAGGDTCGLEKAGWKVTHFSEFKAIAVSTHKAAFPSSQLLTSTKQSTNIKNIPDETFAALKGSVDLIFAGFPCQGFSHAGKKRDNDPRNELVHEFVRATRLIQPTWIIGENVKGLLARKGVFPANTPPRPVTDIIREIFDKIGYKITYKVIDAVQVGVPQLRKRLIIVGHKGTEFPHVPWDALVPPLQEKPTIRKFLGSTLEGAVELPDIYKPKEQDPRFWIPTTETEATGEPHSNLVRLVNGIRNLSTEEKKEKNISKEETVQFKEPNGLISFGVRKGGYYGQVLDPDAPSKTIICTYNQCPRLFVGLYNRTQNKYWVRCLTAVECGLIQGFSADYPWQGTEKDKIIQIGNAVPPPLATAVGNILEKITFSDVPQEVEKPKSKGKKKEDDDDEEDEEEDE
jgi:DNA (cytosine-5)-methyltransferase 1